MSDKLGSLKLGKVKSGRGWRELGTPLCRTVPPCRTGPAPCPRETLDPREVPVPIGTPDTPPVPDPIGTPADWTGTIGILGPWAVPVTETGCDLGPVGELKKLGALIDGRSGGRGAFGARIEPRWGALGGLGAGGGGGAVSTPSVVASGELRAKEHWVLQILSLLTASTPTSAISWRQLFTRRDWHSA